MATTIVTKYGSDAPAASDIVRGELAVDTENGRLYTENAAGAVVEIGLKPEANVDVTGTITASGVVTANAGVVVDNITIDGTTLTSTDDFIVDASSDINLDAGGGQVRLKGSGSTFVTFNVDATPEVLLTGGPSFIGTTTSDAALTIFGSDGGSNVNALVFDMAAAGAATFNSSVTADGLTVSGTATMDGLTLGHTAGTAILDVRRGDASGKIAEFHTNTGYGIEIGSSQADAYISSGYAQNLQFKTGNTATTRMTISNAGNVGIGTSSLAAKMHVKGAGTSSSTNSIFAENSSSAGIFAIRDNGDAFILGKTGIGTSSPAENLHVADASDSNAQIRINGSTSTVYSRLYSDNNGVLAISTDGGNQATNSYIMFEVKGTERMRIDASGNLLVGKTAADFSVDGVALQPSGVVGITRDGGVPLILNRKTSDGDIVNFQKSGAVVGSIGTVSTYLTIGKNDTGLLFMDASDYIEPFNLSTNAARDAAIDLGRSGARFKDLYLSSNLKVGGSSSFQFQKSGTHGYINQSDSGDLIFRMGSGFSERARLTASGDLLVGSTSPTIASEMVYLLNDGRVGISAASTTPLIVNRKTSDGDVIEIRKDQAVVGSIGTYSSTMQVGQGNVYLKFANATDSISPANGNGTDNDDSLDLGQSGARFDDIYATNGTIQTSDRNEKQDIAELSDAEQRVAVACKGLLRKFRWKSSVAEKGDEARTHFGIIAQDLQAAFAAEGLNAGDYAMFISTTWTDEETNEERTRMGVRYSELLAFIISAI